MYGFAALIGHVFRSGRLPDDFGMNDVNRQRHAPKATEFYRFTEMARRQSNEAIKAQHDAMRESFRCRQKSKKAFRPKARPADIKLIGYDPGES